MTADPFDISGKTCVITGAGRGLGRAIADGFAARGARVVLSGRNEALLKQACEEIAAAGGHADYGVADVAKEEDVDKLAALVAERYGHADVLVNNAGVHPYYTRTEKLTYEQWREVIDINLNGVFLCCRAFGLQMLDAGKGTIINISSIGGHVALSRSGPYCAAKGGVEMLTKVLALDWAKRGVRVNCLAPGFIATDLTAGMIANEGLNKGLVDSTPMGYVAKAEEFVASAIYLASDASHYMTGQSLVVDGGWTAV